MKNFLWALVAVIILGGGYLLWQNNTAAPSQAEITPSSETVNTNGSSGTNVGVDVNVGTNAPMAATVTYDGKSFSPSMVTIKKGGTVTWVNNNGKDMWVASAQHPSHTAYSGTSRTEHCPDTSGTAFDQCAGDGNYSFKFDKVGTWAYHNHSAPTKFGKVIVVE